MEGAGGGPRGGESGGGQSTLPQQQDKAEEIQRLSPPAEAQAVCQLPPPASGGKVVNVYITEPTSPNCNPRPPPPAPPALKVCLSAASRKFSHPFRGTLLSAK